MRIWHRFSKLPITVRAAIIGGIFVVVAALITVSPTFLGKWRDVDGLKLVDVIIDDTDLFPKVDLRLRNVGEDVVYIAEVRAVVLHIAKLTLPPVAPMLQPLTGTYQLTLPLDEPRIVSCPVSQVLAPDRTDRFEVTLGSPRGVEVGHRLPTQ